MANQGPSYGFSREVRNKMASKYDEYVEEDLRQWIADTSGCPIMIEQTFQNWLKDGTVLCYLIDSLQPDLLPKGMPHQSMLNPFRCMENINAFLEAIKLMGVPELSVCTTADLYNGHGMSQVQTCLLAVVDVAISKGLTETEIGIRIPPKQNKEWSDSQLRAGDSIIGLQAGTNKFASQSGMTAYGSSRPAYDRKYTSANSN
uniref:Transgelin n=1 Tax=Ciona savignyi TaxID=51511 RepID=H2ZDY2_CIOSA